MNSCSHIYRINLNYALQYLAYSLLFYLSFLSNEMSTGLKDHYTVLILHGGDGRGGVYLDWGGGVCVCGCYLDWGGFLPPDWPLVWHRPGTVPWQSSAPLGLRSTVGRGPCHSCKDSTGQRSPTNMPKQTANFKYLVGVKSHHIIFLIFFTNRKNVYFLMKGQRGPWYEQKFSNQLIVKWSISYQIIKKTTKIKGIN